MYASECMTYPTEELGCADHGQVDCLCDVQPLEGGVPIRAVPYAERLLELGISRLALVAWAEEISTLHEQQSLQLVAEA